MDRHETSSGRLPALGLIGLFAALTALAAGAQTPSEGDLEFFEAKVRPLLIDKCFECHASTSKRVKGGFKLDTYDDLLRGGENGPVVVPGDVEASPLVKAVRYDGELQMPPKEQLDAASINVLEEWVKRKVPMPAPAAGAVKPAVTHWAFQPMSNPQPPDVHDVGWCSNDIDHFILAGLEARAMQPAKRAGRATLLRRLSFDLIGLPPSNAELERFEKDRTPNAWEFEVDRLLASPHYGERWGRGWLDLARYSDSNGLDENLVMGTAYRYRDWVVSALNADLPYDKFLTCQLAGDLLPEPDDAQALRGQLTATGFLVLGPKMLAEQDKEKLAFDIVDEQIDVAFRTFQGLTLGCARCHDHKFDPISQRDYTAVAGMFKSTSTMGSLAFVSRWNERELAPKAQIEARHAAEEKLEQKKHALEVLRTKASAAKLAHWTADSAAYLLAATAAAKSAVILEAEAPSRGNLIRDDSNFGSAAVVIARTGADGLQYAEYDLNFTSSGQQQLEVRMASEEARPMRVLLDGAVVFESALSDITGSWKSEGQRWITVGALAVHTGRNVLRLEREGSVPHLDQLLLTPLSATNAGPGWPVAGNALAQGLEPAVLRAFAIRLESAGRQNDAIFGLWSRFAALPASDFDSSAESLIAQLRTERDAQTFVQNPLVLSLLDGLPPRSLRELAGRYQTLISGVEAQWRELRVKEPKAERLAGEAPEALRQVVHGSASPFYLTAAEMEPLYPEATRAELALAHAAVEAGLHALPPAIDTALGVSDAPEIAGIPLLKRGNHLDKGPEIVPRGVPASIALNLPGPSIPEHQSGRLELAQWMLNPEHPLTSRVAVNRLWQGHFGFGIVRSSSNFGLRGDTPSDPALLDWLARELVRRNWSLKAMHKLICMSSTYQLESQVLAANEVEDPTNRWLSHQNRRRLDAEQLRDALLFTSGALDPTLGGKLLAIGNGDYATNDQSNDAARYDAPRRSIYLPIIRNAMLDLFSAFDYPDSSMTVEQRPSTTSPIQGLYLMNSPLVTQASTRLAKTALDTPGDARDRVHVLYEAAHGREPDSVEVTRALGFLSRATKPRAEDLPHSNIGQSSDGMKPEDTLARESKAWSLLAQVLLVSNEFLFVD